jgi:hypothetical protein
MRLVPSRLAWILPVIVALSLFPSGAVTLLQLNLEDLCLRADRVYRGTVISVEPGSVEMGGGRLPTVTYAIRVDEAFKGSFENRKGERFASLTTIGKMAPVTVDGIRRVWDLSGIPELSVGASYLLFTTPPSAVHLSTPVGLGQGCFRIAGREGAEEAENQFRNIGLFRDMGIDDLPAEGAVSYRRLAAEVRAALARAAGSAP